MGRYQVLCLPKNDEWEYQIQQIGADEQGKKMKIVARSDRTFKTYQEADQAGNEKLKEISGDEPASER